MSRSTLGGGGIARFHRLVPEVFQLGKPILQGLSGLRLSRGDCWGLCSGWRRTKEWKNKNEKSDNGELNGSAIKL